MDRADYRKKIAVGGQDYHFYDIHGLEEKGIAAITKLPYTIKILVENLLRKLDGQAVKEDGREINFETIARLDTEVDVAYFKNGGILPYVLRKMLKEEYHGKRE